MKRARWIHLILAALPAILIVTGCGKKPYVYEPPTGGPLAPGEGEGYGTDAEGQFQTSPLDGEEVNVIPNFNDLEIGEQGFAGPAGRIPDGPKMQIPELQTVYFDFDTSTLRRDQENVLRQNAEYLLSNPGVRVEVQGHCDERGTDEYNMALGDRRALTVRAYLTAAGIEAERIFTISYGEAAPAVEGDTEDAYAQNRRAEFWVIRETEGI
jgi:peptidoglycan-associated lipoprotein